MELYAESYFDKRLSRDRRRETVWKEVSRFFSPLYPRPLEVVVEVGAGYCFWINALEAKSRIAVDIAPIVKEYAAEGVRAVVGSATDLSFIGEGSVDAVLASNLFEHLEQKEL